jgi:hypothetical protein
MIPKEIMKRGGILSHLAQLEEESPYKPDIVFFFRLNPSQPQDMHL